MALRDRSNKTKVKQEPVEVPLSDSSFTTSESSEDDMDYRRIDPKVQVPTRVPSPARKVPRVILKLGPPPQT